MHAVTLCGLPLIYLVGNFIPLPHASRGNFHSQGVTLNDSVPLVGVTDLADETQSDLSLTV